MSKLPSFKWAERTDKVYVTIDVQDVTDPEISVTTTGETSEVSFKAVGGTDKEPYALKFATFKAVDEEKSKWAVGPRHVVFVLIKKEEGYWERLLAAGVKMNNLKVDFDKWVDEDEEQTDANFGDMDFSGMGGGGGMGGMDMESLMKQMGAGGMGGMGGMGDMGGVGEGDDSDDDVPELEDDTAASA